MAKKREGVNTNSIITSSYYALMLLVVSLIYNQMLKNSEKLTDVLVLVATQEVRLEGVTDLAQTNSRRILALEATTGFRNTQPPPPESPSILNQDPLNNPERRKLRKAKER